MTVACEEGGTVPLAVKLRSLRAPLQVWMKKSFGLFWSVGQSVGLRKQFATLIVPPFTPKITLLPPCERMKKTNASNWL